MLKVCRHTRTKSPNFERNMGINMIKNRKRIHFLLAAFINAVIILGITIYYIRNNTVIFMNQEVYIDVVNESEIRVKGLPINIGNFSAAYMIKKTDALKILDQQGREIDFESLKEGNILIFSYKGFIIPKSYSYLNRGIYDIRLSGEVFNNKFWNVEFGDEGSWKSQPEQTLINSQTEEKKQEDKNTRDIENEEPQIVTSKESKMGYNGVNYPIEAWNADLSLEDAFRNSCVWYFRKIIDEVGQEEVQKELQSLKYGNCDISEWNGNIQTHFRN